MSGEAKDPAIKLFGKTIPLHEIQQKNRSCSPHQYKNIDILRVEEREKRQGNEEGEGEGDDDDEQCEKELLERDSSARALGEGSGNGENSRTPPLDEENSAPNNSKAREKQIEDGDRKEQKTTLKKPDKILPCPRCNSMETKFCYYNNYNVKQPRHFCKKCQRYWTAGGTMRNLPVGAGRRKSKSSFASFNNQCHHLAIAEALQSSSRQLYESRSSVLSHTEKTLISNRCHKPNAVVVPTSYANQENEFEHPGSSGKTGPTAHGVISPLGFPSRVSCFPLPPALFPPPGLALPVNPIAAVAAPAAYWGFSVPASWTLVASLPQPLSANISVSTNPSSGKNSPALGKRPREESLLRPVDLEGDGEPDSAEWCLWKPKTLRIDDPGEAAKSSTWATLGISKNGSKANSVSGVTLFKAFHTKAEDKDRTIETSPVLQANPAALFRSLNFIESS